jgi:23S rRNA U2552 (ribose-2'-O)-methylase RlmE/FtsJ
MKAVHLNNLIVDFCGKTLKPGGNLLMKIIMGPAEERLQKEILL